MHLRSTSIRFACALALTSPAAAQSTIYVDANATPPGSGVQSAPFVTITQAMNLLGPGMGPATTISVAPGTYVENVTCSPKAVLVSQQGPLVTVIRAAQPGVVVRLPFVCDCLGAVPKVDGFTITGGTGPNLSAAVQLAEGWVTNCILTGNGGSGYYALVGTAAGAVTQTTIAGNDNGLLVYPDAAPSIVRVALENRVTNYAALGFDPNVTSCVGTGLPAGSGNEFVDPGFWNATAGDYHLRPNAPASAVLGGGFAGALPFDASYVAPNFAFCDGANSFSDHTTACPCGNAGAAGHGCASAASASGARLAASGRPEDDDVVLHATDMGTTALGVYLQHDGTTDRVFHDGVLCAGGNLLRLRYRAVVGSESTFPDAALPEDATITLAQRGFVTPGSGSVRF